MDSARIDGATIWGVPVEHPSGWALTAMRGPRLYLHRMTDDLAVIGAPTPLTFFSDPTGITDHRLHFGHGSPLILLREGHLYMGYDAAGQGVFVHKYRVEGGTEGTGPETPVRAPGALGPSYPNPCTGSCTAIRIPFVPPRAGGVRLAIVDGAGRHVRAVTWSSLAPRAMTWTWDGTADSGEPVASGVYFSRLEAAGGTWTRRMTLVR